LASFIILRILFTKEEEKTPEEVATVKHKSDFKPVGFIITHFSGSGFNNQLHQILNGLAIANALNRTYCLSPFLRRKSDESNAKTN